MDDKHEITETGTDRYRAPALDKGLDILEILASQPRGLTRAEIVKEMGLGPSQIYRMLERLVARGLLLRIEPYMFLLFCAHLILIWLGGPMLGLLFGTLGSPLYPAYLIAQPLLVLVAVVVIGMLLGRSAPGAAALLSGGRLRAT